MYVVSVNSCDKDLSKSHCILCQNKDNALTTAFSYATSQDDNITFSKTGCYSLCTYSIITHCLEKDIYGHMNSLYKTSQLSPIVTGNVYIDYDVDLDDIFTDITPVSPIKSLVKDDNKLSPIVRDRELQKQDYELENLRRCRMMEINSRNDELERERIFNNRYHHDYNLRHRRRNRFIGVSSYPMQCDFRDYEHIPFADEVQVDIDKDTGSVTSIKKEAKKSRSNYDDYDTNFWSTDESEDGDGGDDNMLGCQDEPDELDGTLQISQDVSDSGIKITVIEDSDDENLSDTNYKRDMASIQNAFAEMEKIDKIDKI